MATPDPVAIVCLAAAVLFPSALVGQAPDPVNGTWEMNPAKSTFNPGPPSKSETRTYEMVGNSLKLATVVVDANGTSRTVESRYTVDGKVYPVTGAADVDGQSMTQIDRFTVEVNMIKNGRIVRTARRTVSGDGKVLTISFKGTDAKGQKFDNLLVFERIKAPVSTCSLFDARTTIPQWRSASPRRPPRCSTSRPTPMS